MRFIVSAIFLLLSHLAYANNVHIVYSAQPDSVKAAMLEMMLNQIGVSTSSKLDMVGMPIMGTVRSDTTSANVVAVFITKEFVEGFTDNSVWVKQEIAPAEQAGVKIVPIFMDVDPTSAFIQRHSSERMRSFADSSDKIVSLNQGIPQGYKSVAAALKEKLGIPRR